MYKNWIAFFSQTGTEVNNVSTSINRYPDLVVTNSSHGNMPGELYSQSGDVIHVDSRPTLGDYKRILSIYDPLETLITLHGWLRIVPDEICEQYSIYNGHPGDIVNYPELKGFNPQEKAVTKGLYSSGCVIHEVTRELDGGKIISFQGTSIAGMTQKQVYKVLADISRWQWRQFFIERLMTNDRTTGKLNYKVVEI